MEKQPFLSPLAELEHYRYGKSSFDYALEQSRKKRGHTLSCLVIHSEPHAPWAIQLSDELMQTFPTLIDGITLNCTKLLISGNQAEVKDQLAQELNFDPHFNVQAYSFIITVGEWESQTVHRIREEAEITIPQLHCMPGVPVSTEPPLNSVRNKCPITGVYSHPTSSQEYIWALKAIAPHLKSVCIVFDDNDNDDEEDFFAKHKQRRELKDAFKKAGLQAIAHYWSLKDARLIDLEVTARSVDAILLPNSPTTHVNIQAIKNIGARNKVILCSAELDSVISGASIGAGIIGAGFAAPLMSLMIDIILSNEIAAATPIKIPQQSGLRYNLTAMTEQGVQLSQEQLMLLRMKSITDKDITEY